MGAVRYSDKKRVVDFVPILQKEQLQKLRSGLIAQLRQRLAYEFPEIVRHKMEISPVRGFTRIIGWLAGVHQEKRYDNKYACSVAHELNIEFCLRLLECYSTS